ncbi:fungal specific transcription factor domain-containing protein [Candidatus Bathyarchaeota archaeon]|nr:fungal specific transcription factor domain-containing protein [Candidatus Bathyarchaeota archaeon]
MCRLSVTMSDILSCIYTERSSGQSAAELSGTLESLNSRLAAWREALPEHLVFDPNDSTQSPPPHVINLQ